MKKTAWISLSLLLAACAHVDPNDPLKNTKKLAVEGHRTLYENGAFRVPSTKIKIIPEGPRPLELATELALPTARASFLLALRDASDSVVIVRENTARSLGVATTLHEGSVDVGGKAVRTGHRDAKFVVERSLAMGKDLALTAWTWPKRIDHEMEELASTLANGTGQASRDFARSLRTASVATKEEWLRDSAAAERKLTEESGKHAHEAIRRFVEGYVAFPGAATASIAKVGSAETMAPFSESLTEANAHRARRSVDLDVVYHGVVEDLKTDTSRSFANAGTELRENSAQIGSTLASLRAMGWALQAVFWDGTIKPAGRLASAGIGYLVVNGIVFPAELTVKEGVNVGRALVQVVQSTGEVAYELTAPTVASAYSVILAGGAWTTGKVVRAGAATSAYAVAGAVMATAPVVETTVGVGGQLTSTAIRYFAAPVAGVGAVTAGTVGGAMIAGTGVATGAGVEVVGATVGTASAVVGETAAATTAIVGTAGAVTLGAANAAYGVVKATVVPTSQVVTGGVVLSYGMASQIAAQTLLGVADAAYLVLSMEGPSYVVYAIEGKTGAGQTLPVGSVIDLDAARKHGEVLRKVPLSGEETKRVLNELGKETAQP